MGSKKLIVAVLLLISFQSFASDTILISDFDDTIKQTNVGSTAGSVVNGVFSTKAFAGMNDLFASMDSYTNGLYILSNSPNILRYKIFKLLNKHNLSPLEVSTRNLIRNRDGFKYKYSYVVSKIKNLNTKVILFGDDVGEDPEVYAKVKKNFPNKVSEIYIHVVKDRKLPSGVVDYITAFDIATNEYKNDRMNLNQALILGTQLLYDYNMANVLPKFAHCPTSKDRWENNSPIALMPLVLATSHKIVKYCQSAKIK